MIRKKGVTSTCGSSILPVRRVELSRLSLRTELKSREVNFSTAEMADLKCPAHPLANLIEDHRAGDLICPECGLVVGDR